MSRHLMIIGGINREWQCYGGDWNPHDPARYIQPSTFPSCALLYQPRGNNEDTSLPLKTGTNTLTYGPTWEKYRGNIAGTWTPRWGINISASFTLQAGPWSGPIVDLLPVNDPSLAAFGPATFTLPNGTKQSNPLSTRLRYVYPTRGEAQVQPPAIKTLGLTIGKRFKFGERFQFEPAGHLFNLLNGGDFTQYNYNGADEKFNPNFLQMRNQQPARAFQLTGILRF